MNISCRSPGDTLILFVLASCCEQYAQARRRLNVFQSARGSQDVNRRLCGGSCTSPSISGATCCSSQHNAAEGRPGLACNRHVKHRHRVVDSEHVLRACACTFFYYFPVGVRHHDLSSACDAPVEAGPACASHLLPASKQAGSCVRCLLLSIIN